MSTVAFIKLLLTLAIQLVKIIKIINEYHDSLTPEQQEELKEERERFRIACLELKDPMGGPESGSGP